MGLGAWLCCASGPDSAHARPALPAQRQRESRPPRGRTQQAPQSCAPTSKALTLSSASLVALPKPDLQKTKQNKQQQQQKKQQQGSINGRRIRPKRPGGSNSWEARTGAAGLGARLSPPFLPGRCSRRVCLGYPSGQAAQRSYRAQREAAAVQVQGQKLKWGGARGIDFTPILSLAKLKRVFLTS